MSAQATSTETARRLGATAPRLTRPQRTASTRRALLDAAERRFLRDGYHATPLEGIASDAGYTKGAIFAAFESKAGLFLALCDEVVDRQLDQIRALPERCPTAEARLAALAAQPIDRRNQRWLLLAIEFWTQSEHDPALRDELAARYWRLRDGLAAIASHEPGASSAQGWATVMLALLNGLTLARVVDPDGLPDDLMSLALARVQRPAAREHPRRGG